MQFKQILTVVIILISPALYGQNFSASNSTLNEDSDITPLTLRLPSSFSYHIIKDITEFQIAAFTRNVLNAGRNIQFLNAVEYSNIAHALEMRVGDMLYNGNDLIAILADLYPLLFLSLSRELPENSEFREEEVKGLYLQDIEFHEYIPRFGESRWIIDVFVFGRIMNNGQTLITKVICDKECNQKLEEIIGSDWLYSQILSRLSYSLSQSFEDLLIAEGIPQDYSLTLYLKDLSSENNSVNNFTDVERINIGIIVEDSQGQFIREIDWILEKPELENIRVNIEESIIVPFHESAHALVKNALSDNYRSYLSIESALYLFDNEWHYREGLSKTSYTSYPIDQPQWFQQGVILLAGKVSEELFFNTQISETVSPTNIDTIKAIFVTFKLVCSDRSNIYNESLCALTNDFNNFNQWLLDNQTSLSEDSPFMREIRAWLSRSHLVAQAILTNDFEVLIELTRLALQKGSLNNQDFQDFFQEFPTQRFPFENFSITEEDRHIPPFDIGPDILDRNLSLLFSLDSQRNIDKVRRSSIQNILTEVETVEIPTHISSFIRREPIDGDIEQNYSQGLPSLYLRECVNIFVESLTS